MGVYVSRRGNVGASGWLGLVVALMMGLVWVAVMAIKLAVWLVVALVALLGPVVGPAWSRWTAGLRARASTRFGR